MMKIINFMLLQDIGFELSGKIGGSAIREIKRVGKLAKSNHEISFLATHCSYEACTNKNIHCHLLSALICKKTFSPVSSFWIGSKFALLRPRALKEHLCLERHRARGLRKITIHALIYMISMLFTALAARRLEKPEKVKSIAMFARQVEIDTKRSIWQKVGAC